MNWFKKIFGPTEKPAVQALAITPELRERAIKEIDDYAGRDVVGGFRSEAEIIESVTEVLADDFEGVSLKPLVAERTRQLLEKHSMEEASWSEQTDCDRLDRAFAELESRGIVCRQDFSCCGTCGSGEIWDEIEKVRSKGGKVRGYAFYHQQDTEGAVESGGLYLAYGAEEKGEAAAEGIAREICEALRSHGLDVKWDGAVRTRVFTKLDWKRRRRCMRS